MRWILPAIVAGCSAGGAMIDAGPDAPILPFQDASNDAGPMPDAGPKKTGLHVVGAEIHDGNDKLVRLLGVNRSGSEYACVQGSGIFDGPVDDAAIAAIKTWTANAVRIPLNEDCWLGINGVSAQYSGMAYKAAIADLVMRLLAQGIHPILELHWSAPGAELANKQLAMPDKDHTPAFWSDVAKTFGSNDDIVFELFNEPFPDNNQDTEAAWTCWKSGGTCPGIAYQAAGMQDLVDAVRQAGAHNLILLGGVEYSNSLSGWSAHKPNDPESNVAAAWHVYNFNTCANPTCYDQYAGVLLQTTPIVTTEIGEDDCSGQFITTLMDWLDKRNQSYLGWVWDTWGGCLVLIKDYQGTPAGTYGQTFKTHIMSIPH